jgi:putative acetyltransferase
MSQIGNRRPFNHSNRSAMNFHLRRANSADHVSMLTVWERSVRATHGFLVEDDIETLRPLVAEEFSGATVDWWLFIDDVNRAAGFLGYSTDCIEGLFIDPDFRGRGAGSSLVAHAERLASGPLRVDVNEQNDDARRFYEAMGFVVAGRSETDTVGRPFPLLHMRRLKSSRQT